MKSTFFPSPPPLFGLSSTREAAPGCASRWEPRTASITTVVCFFHVSHDCSGRRDLAGPKERNAPMFSVAFFIALVGNGAEEARVAYLRRKGVAVSG